ncbi:MAG: hypothetical protein AAF125_06170, partial [Chloroflexota bacterium]
QWRAKVGFNYDVESFKSEYANGEWSEKRIIETKVDWDERVGVLSRHFPNTATQAMERHADLIGDMQKYINTAQPYDEEAINHRLVRLPEITPDDGLSQAKDDIRRQVSRLCVQAASGNKVEDFEWAPVINNENWTLMLVPTVVSYYLDDDGVKRRVRVNEHNGIFGGVPRRSVKRAKEAARRALLMYGIGGAIIYGVCAAAIGVWTLSSPDNDPLNAIAVAMLVPLPVIVIALSLVVSARGRVRAAQRFNDEAGEDEVVFKR